MRKIKMGKKPMPQHGQKNDTATHVKNLTRLLGMNDICRESLNCHRATGWRMLRAGILPPPTVKVGRIVKWNSDVIEAWVTAGVKRDGNAYAGKRKEVAV